MRTLQRFATVCFLGAAAAALITACSSTDAAPPAASAGAAPAAAGAAGAHAGAGNTAGAGNVAGAGGSSAGAPATLTGDPTHGQAAYNKPLAGCPGCHNTMGEGMGGPNITGSTTAGIGGKWTEPQFHEAVRSAKNRKGVALYALMAPVSAANLSDQEIADIYAWLMSIKIDTPETGSYCATGMCTGSQ